MSLKVLTAIAWKVDCSSSEAWAAVCAESAGVLCIARTRCCLLASDNT